MIARYVIPGMAVVLLGFGVFYVVKGREVWPADDPPLPPPSSPYTNTVAGVGIVEAQTRNISIGSPLPGVLVELYVDVGQRVAARDPLFRLDDRQLQAELQVQLAALDLAKAERQRLEQQPRPEQIPVSQALVQEAQANLANEEFEFRWTQELHGRNAAAQDELQRREQSFRVAEARLARAKAEFELLQAGAWAEDRAVAEVGVAQAQARVEQVRTELDRLIVRAPVDGDVLQVNVRTGEFVGAPAGQPLIVLGDVRQVHVRVDIDEHDIPRFVAGSPARAVARGAPDEYFPLRFVRVEPLVIPKRSLTGDVAERVDTRVLQIVYRVESQVRPLFVGQQMDVFIDVSPPVPAGGGTPTASAAGDK